jgi:ubiquinone/menaquinone biosynthesis C-methylase UbiE
MNASEYANLDAVEGQHWYYAGKRELVRWWLRRYGPPRPDQVLLDCGAGTGRFAAEMAAECRVFVLDDHEESLRLLRQHFRPEQILTLAGDAIPLPDASLDYVTALDVLEHVPDDAAVVRGFARLVRPGGIAAITVPASMALWSDWDVALHHYRRYHRRQLAALFDPAAWEIVYLNYTNVVVFPAVWLVRKTRVLLARLGAGPSTGRTEDRLPPAWLNALLRRLFVGLAKTRLPFPFGVSLLLVARRRGGDPGADGRNASR